MMAVMAVMVLKLMAEIVLTLGDDESGNGNDFQ
jgi:hypothetical protein